MSVNQRLLLVEDDDSIARSLVGPLESAGFRVDHVSTGADAVAAQGADVILLDLGLPDMDGYDEFDRVLGLELGADDYMVKPLGTRELIARIRAVLRRTSGRAVSVDIDEVLSVGPLSIDRRTHRIYLGGEEVPFTPKEFELLVFLAEDAGAVRTRTDIVEHVWDANWFGPTKTVDAHVASIRRKLGSHSWIESVRGVGFRLVEPTDS
jgi:two-component system response regulator RegX3